MTNFIDIEIEGFGSLQNRTSFSLDRGNTLNVITGRVGSGKTSILNSFVWCLYGKSLKEKGSITTLPEYQKEGFRGTKVTTRFETDLGEFEVIRCKSFRGNINIEGKKVKGGNNIFMFHNGKPYESEGKGKVNLQTEINKILGYSFELFKNAILFGQKMKRIIQESGPDKKKVFEEAFEMIFIEEAKTNVTAERKKLVDTISELGTRLTLLDSKLDNRETLRDKALDTEQYFEKDRQKDIDHYKDKIQSNLKNIETLNKVTHTEGNYAELLMKKKNLILKINKFKNNNTLYLDHERNIKMYQGQLSQLIGEQSKGFKKCSECGSPINEKQQKINRKHNKDKQVALEKNIANLREQFMKLEHEDTSKLEKELKDVEVKIGIILQNEKDNELNLKAIEVFKKSNKKLKDYIKDIEKEELVIRSDFYTKLISKLTRDRKKLLKHIEKLNKELEIQNWLINDPLSNNGLKAYIFNNLLGKVNDKLADYSRILQFNIEFGIDLDSHRKDFYQLIERAGTIIPYEDLSGGQQQLVDTSVAFAINDVISEIKPTNVLFLDEPFESLGAEEIEIISELIYEKSKTKSVYLITHHQSFSTTNAETIYVELGEDFNTIIHE